MPAAAERRTPSQAGKAGQPEPLTGGQPASVSHSHRTANLQAVPKRRRSICDSDDDAQPQEDGHSASQECAALGTPAQDEEPRPSWSSSLQTDQQRETERRSLALEEAIAESRRPLLPHAEEPRPAREASPASPGQTSAERPEPEVPAAKDTNASLSTGDALAQSASALPAATALNNPPTRQHKNHRGGDSGARAASLSRTGRVPLKDLRTIRKEREAARAATLSANRGVHVRGASMRDSLQALIRSKRWSMMPELPPLSGSVAASAQNDKVVLVAPASVTKPTLAALASSRLVTPRPLPDLSEGTALPGSKEISKSGSWSTPMQPLTDESPLPPELRGFRRPAGRMGSSTPSSAVDEDVLRGALHLFLGETADLTSLNYRQVRVALETKLQCDLHQRKDFIKQECSIFLQQQTAGS